MCPRGSPAVIG